MPALAPQMPSALPRRSGGKPLTAPASGTDQPGPSPLDHARDDQRAEARDQRAGDRADREQRQATEGQAPGTEPVDQLAPGDQQQRVGGEVSAQHGRGRAALDAQPVRDRRQRDGDQGAVELKQRAGRRARRQPRPGGPRNRRPLRVGGHRGRERGV